MLRTLLIVLHALLQPPEDIVVSRYADTRRDEGGTPACWRRMPDEDFDRMYPRRCASRTLPCGTAVALSSDLGSGVCYVLDRGPYGRDAAGRYRGQLDLSPVPASEVGIASPTRGPGRIRARAWVLPRR